MDGQRINHVWDGSQQIVADIVDNQFYEAECYIRGTSLAATYNYCNDEKSSYTYYIQNAHGDVVNLTDADGVVIKSYTYDAFGVELDPTTGDVNAFRYCGEYFDTETGTVYLRARYYQASIGRFTQRDSYIGDNQSPLSLNLYTYCANNPLPYFDPSGHKFSFKKFVEGWNDSWQWVGESAYEINTGFVNEAKASAKKAVDESVSTWTNTKIKPFVRDQLTTHRSGLDMMKEWMSKNDRTLSVGNSLTFGGGHSLISFSQCFTFDTNGALASQWSWNLGATSDEATHSYSYYYCVTNAPSYNNLNGNGYSAGGGIVAPVYGSLGVGTGLDFVAVPDANDQGIEYGGTMGSLLIGTPGKEMHAQTGMTYTSWSCCNLSRKIQKREKPGKAEKKRTAPENLRNIAGY